MSYPYSLFVNLLARAIAAGRIDRSSTSDRIAKMVGYRHRWIGTLVDRLMTQFPGCRPRTIAIVDFLLRDASLKRAFLARRKKPIEIVQPLVRPMMVPVPALRACRVPALTRIDALADWLGVRQGELEWFADRWSRNANRPVSSQHYHYRFFETENGGVRLIEAVKPRLKEMQRRILKEILDRVPSHDAAHGFRPGRSVKTFVEPHIGQSVVVRLDLQQFFPTIRAHRVHAVYRAIGYPDFIADYLTGLCVNATPWSVWQGTSLRDNDPIRWLYSDRHLPQGAPTSPALANLVAFQLDRRLAALAGKSGWEYTRYADDLAFSGSRSLARPPFLQLVEEIVRDEGFRIHPRKTRIMRESTRQKLTGLIINNKANIPRRQFDELKAILTNCLRSDPQSQNREARPDFRSHLAGRIGYVEMINPRRGKRLRELFEKIQW